jgi:hypothetical protein
MIVSWRLVDKVNGATAMLAVRDGCRRYGLPGELYVDNGTEYKNKNSGGQTVYKGKIAIAHLDGYLERIGLRQRHAIVKNPESKAQVERWFATLSGSFLNIMDAYTGGNITSKTRVKDDARLKADLKAGRVLDYDEAKTLAGQIVAAYNAAPHSAHNGRSPYDVWHALYGRTADGESARPIVHPDERVLDFALMRRALPRVIRNSGMPLYNETYLPRDRGDRRFIHAIGRKGYIAYDPEDTTTAYLYALVNGREQYVCDLVPSRGTNAADEYALRREFFRKKADQKELTRAAAKLTDRTIDVSGVLRRGVLGRNQEQQAEHADRFPVGGRRDDAVAMFPAGGQAEARAKQINNDDGEGTGGLAVTNLFGRL